MKIRNKKTGEILATNDLNVVGEYDSLAELNEEWEDYEEPEEYWYIDDAGVMQIDQVLSSEINMRKSIGNYFETREEAEKAVEKLKAWKRLKDTGFQITGWDNSIGDDYYKTGQIVLNLNNVIDRNWDEYGNIDDIKADLDLLFGGEE